MALRRGSVLRRLLQAGEATRTPMRAMCTGISGENASSNGSEAKSAEESSKSAEVSGSDRPPELVFAGAMFHSSTDWILRASVESFCSLLDGKKKMNTLGLRYLRKSGLRQAILGGKPDYPLILEKESRIGKQPITVPKGVSVKIDGQDVAVEGPLGTLSWKFRDEVGITREGDTITVKRVIDSKKSRAMHGLSRTLLNNMLVGVSQGFEKKLTMVGVGYRATVDKDNLVLSIGYKEPEIMRIPEGLKAKVEENTKITLSGYNNVLLGNFAALIRSKRRPEPYKGKGIRYSDEVVRRKLSSKNSKKKK